MAGSIVLSRGSGAQPEVSRPPPPPLRPATVVPLVTERAPVILIDPGHGGTNSGAPSVHPLIFEKHVTLALAGSLRRSLESRGIKVLLTRTQDTYLTLRQRGQMANELDVDLFVSLHANASENHSHSGYETYILSPNAVDVDSRALRQRFGRVREGVTPDTSALLNDIERSTTQLLAAKIATRIQQKMSLVRGAAGDRGVRQESMHVLLGATMPALLIEVGFIDHPIEGAELLKASLRNKIAETLAEAIHDYTDEIAHR